MIRICRKTTVVAVFTVACCAIAVPASAGPFLDWLHGRNTTPNPAYAAANPGFAVADPASTAGCAPYAAGYAPSAAGYSPYAAGYSPYAAGYAPVTANAPVTAYSPAITNHNISGYNPYRGVTAYSPGLTGGTVSTVDANPAPITYAPPPAGVTAYSPGTASTPVTTYAPALPIPTTGSVAGSQLYGTGNLYPDSTAYAAYSVPTSYAAYSVPTAAPAYAVAPRVGPIRRLLQALFGTGYRTSYYRAPVTYYRPATTVGASGAPVTALSPCTSYQIQTQRTPVHSYAPATAVPSTGCPDPCASYAAPTAGCADCGPATTSPYSGTIQPTSPAMPGTAAPGTGYPSSAPTTITPDTQPLQAPQLAPGQFSTPQGVQSTQSSYGSPPRYRQPYSNVKPIPALESDESDSGDMDTRILPGDRTAAVREPGFTSAAVRTVAAQSTQDDNRRALYLRSAQPKSDSVSQRPAEKKKVYQRAQWNGVK